MRAITYFAAIAAIAAVPFTSALAQATMSEEECTALIQKADKNADGSLAGTEAEKYLERIEKTDVKLSEIAFNKEGRIHGGVCKRHILGIGSPVKGQH